MEYSISEKGRKRLINEGYMFYKDKSYSGKTIWKCIDFEKKKCSARLHTNDDAIVKTINQHNHSADAAFVEAQDFVYVMKEQGKRSFDSPHQIVATTSTIIPSQVAPKLPSVISMKQSIRRARLNANCTPKLAPKSAKELTLPESYKLTTKKENFVLYDNGEGSEERIIIFGTKTGLSMLKKSEHWFVDGTFKTVPTIFTQLYTIHGIFNSNIVPAVYMILPNKKQSTYSKCIQELLILNYELNPKTIMIDFEKGAINAFKNAFPHTCIKGCFFHFNQSVYRKVQEFGLKRRYDTDSAFALKLRLLCALAFIPVEEAVMVFEELIDAKIIPEEANEVVDYFEDTWIGRPDRRNGRRPPLFSIEMWNCYSRVIDNLPKTNNNIEGWHRSFAQLINCNHPNIWNFIEALQKEQSRNELMMEKFIAGETIPQKKKYKDKAHQLKIVTMKYKQIDNLSYLKGIAYNFNF